MCKVCFHSNVFACARTMYSRRSRLLTRPALSTAPGVGPGTYRLDNERKRTGESYAPFQCMEARESFLIVDKQLAAAPGPAHYTPALEEHVKGGDSLMSKAGRFGDLQSRTPGPGTYSISKRSDWFRKTYPPPTEKDVLFLNEGVVKSGRLLFTRKPTAPSIPTPGKSCGYNETEEGNLTPQPLPPQDSTMGPAYYDVSYDATTTTAKYKGVHFGNLQSLRTQFKGREGPGPGDYYSAMVDDKGHSHGERSTTMSHSLPRYHILVTKQEEKKAVPGPGQYELSSQFSASKSSNGTVQNVNEEEEDEEDEDGRNRAPFGSQQQRFISPKYHSPACTAYQDPRSAFSLGKAAVGGGGAPFGETALRFRSNRLAKEIPGPGAYNNSQMTSLVADLSRKSQFHGTFKCPFGSTSLRTAPLIKRDQILGPGPAHYQQGSASGKEADRSGKAGKKIRNETRSDTEKPSYTFASTTSRLYSPPSIVTDIPPPGSYEVSESYSRSQDRTLSSVRRSLKGGFLSSSSRSAPPRDIMLEEPDIANPGPGDYESKDALGKGKPGLLCQKDIRFKPIGDRVPGPGAYTLSKVYRDTVLHGTYNVTLNNPLTASDRHSPEKMIKKHSLVVEA